MQSSWKDSETLRQTVGRSIQEHGSISRKLKNLMTGIINVKRCYGKIGKLNLFSSKILVNYILFN